MQLNFIIVLCSAIIPMIVGFIWYNPKVFGSAWMKETGITMDDAKGMNMGVIFGVSLLFAVMLAMSLMPSVIHQMSFDSVFMNDEGIKDPNSEISLYMKNFHDTYDDRFRTFKHGLFHGVLMSLFIVLPVIGTNAMYERRSKKYIALTVGYWAVSLGLMGGVICAFA
jgi:Protein of unknown function (DUF1761)